MSMMKTLARVAAGVMLAKGIGAVMNKGGQAQAGSRTTGGGILGDLLGNNTGAAGSRQAGSGGLGDLLGQVLGGQSAGAGRGTRYGGPNSAGAQGGLGGILDQLTKASAGGAAAGGLGGLLGGLLGGAAGAGSLAQKGAQASNDATFGELFNDALSNQNEPEVAPTADQNAVAALMLKAMIQAAKADGQIDDAEKQRLLGQLGDIDDEERAFIQEQMKAPVDPQALAREVPQGLAPQVYMMSLMAIDFDSKAEAQYLHALAQAMGLNQQVVNQIHEQIGVQNLYA
ncbi:MAG: tellurite resistance TerB family protein [Paracoccus sp. (in: a-proteobacteria)]|uniref:tellurite resistance TerB family protein n=1 Tax=Paracoccus sp. TaxID=267 RepID=UPI0026E0F345|nr:tellurite resistance TerB family protein [Paracoccus sp. (in: a-proteobacteria)]MDO5620686.1 tellurite resistance TerB family protein [Paracoccus sp. (in: a-proteobacteria)]